MTTVYIVTSGEYSGFGMDAVFSTRELAEEYKARWAGDRIEEWTLDEPNPRQKPGQSYYYIVMWKDGDVSFAKEWTPPTEPAADHIWLQGRPRIGVHCWAKDKQHAIKIANERRTRAIAEDRM